MRFVELIHLCSAASSSPELCCVDEAGSELMRGKVGRTRSVGLSPCPPVPSVFPRFSAVGHRPVSLGWLGKATLVTGQGFGGCSGPALCLQVSGGGQGAVRGCRGWHGRAEPFRDSFWRFQGLPCPSALFKGERLLCLGAGTQGKLSRVKVCQVSRAGGASDLRSPPGLFSRTGGCSCKEGAGEGGFPEEKVRREWGGSGWALLNCRCWGICKLVALTRTGNGTGGLV